MSNRFRGESENHHDFQNIGETVGATFAGFSPSSGKSNPQSPHSYQSSPSNSAGCWVRPEPLPQLSESAGQYLSHPQQIRSGCFGCNGNFFDIARTDQQFRVAVSIPDVLASSRTLLPIILLRRDRPALIWVKGTGMGSQEVSSSLRRPRLQIVTKPPNLHYRRPRARSLSSHHCFSVPR